jgi:Flp pilus assembly protein TadG
MGKQKRGVSIMRIKSASQKGAAMVEFALILIPLLILTFGLIEFGLLMYNQQVITNAAREGARYGIVMTDAAHPISTAMINKVVTDYASTHLVSADKITPSASRTCGPGTFGLPLTVSLSCDYTYMVIDNFIPGLGSTKTLTSQAVMRCE